jgi:5-methyltetrahydrofolate--homocysteine methyltransferase
VAALAAAGVDAVCVETMTDVHEAVLAVRAAKAAAPGLPVLATMTFDRTPRGWFTIMGTDVPTAARELAAAGADVIGSNCGNGAANMVEIGRAFAACTDRPLLLQPNAGLPEIVDGRTVYGETPEFFAARAEEMLAAGVAIVGGCCGSTPEHVRALRGVVDRAAAG